MLLLISNNLLVTSPCCNCVLAGNFTWRVVMVQHLHEEVPLRAVHTIGQQAGYFLSCRMIVQECGQQHGIRASWPRTVLFMCSVRYKITTSEGTTSSVWQICTSMRIRRMTWNLTES